MTQGSQVLLHGAAKIGIRVTPASKSKVLSELRARLGACVITPPDEKAFVMNIQMN